MDKKIAVLKAKRELVESRKDLWSEVNKTIALAIAAVYWLWENISQLVQIFI